MFTESGLLCVRPASSDLHDFTIRLHGLILHSELCRRHIAIELLGSKSVCPSCFPGSNCTIPLENFATEPQQNCNLKVWNPFLVPGSHSEVLCILKHGESHNEPLLLFVCQDQRVAVRGQTRWRQWNSASRLGHKRRRASALWASIINSTVQPEQRCQYPLTFWPNEWRGNGVFLL